MPVACASGTNSKLFAEVSLYTFSWSSSVSYHRSPSDRLLPVGAEGPLKNWSASFCKAVVKLPVGYTLLWAFTVMSSDVPSVWTKSVEVVTVIGLSLWF